MLWPNSNRRRATTEPALVPEQLVPEQTAHHQPIDLQPGDLQPGDLPPAGDEEAAETGPLRRCAVTRARLPKERMIRFVIGPDRAVVPDLAERLPGRGIWLSAARDVLETARLRGAFAKAARGPVTVPPDLP